MSLILVDMGRLHSTHLPIFMTHIRVASLPGCVPLEKCHEEKGRGQTTTQPRPHTQHYESTVIHFSQERAHLEGRNALEGRRDTFICTHKVATAMSYIVVSKDPHMEGRNALERRKKSFPNPA